MKTFKELNKEKLLIRSTEPIRASVIGMIIDGTQKIAKSEMREIEEKDLINSTKKLIKETEKAIELIENKNGDSSKWKQELVIYKEFLPPLKTEQQTREAIDIIVSTIGADKKSRGKIMSELRLDSSIDMSIASKILDNILI